MNIIISGKGMDVSDYVYETIEERVGKLERYFPPEAQMQVVVSAFRGRHIIEITVVSGDTVYRGEEKTGDIYASVDGAARKLERQILKHKTKLERRLREGAFQHEQPLYEHENAEAEEPRIVKTKSFAIKPMSEEEAALQMQLLGHDFYVFTNADTNEVNVVYLRNDGNFGLIEPEYS